MVRFRVIAAAWLSMGAAALGADPQLSGVTPPGVQRGTEVDVTLAGARLADAQELLLYYPGVRVAAIEPVKDNPNALKVRLAVAPDCRLGLHALRVRTATGISNLRTFSVGAMREVAEVEPNGDFQAPQKIDLDVTVTGVVENEDVDYFLVEAKQGERLSVEIEGLRLGDTFFDPYLAVMDADRFVLAASDDTPLVYQDAACSLIVPKDGAYVVQVRESAFGGSGQCRYRLHVGRFARPLAVFPPGGRPGETLDARWLGDPAGETAEKVTLPTGAPAVVGLFAQDARGTAPSANPVRVVDLANVFEAEPNNAPAEATPFEAPGACNGVIAAPGDVDHFRFPAKAGQAFDVRVYARALRSPLDSVLTVRRSNGAVVAANDDAGSPDSALRFSAPADDQYVLEVRDQLLAGGPHYVYRIEVAPVRPALTLGLPEREAFVDVTAPVPRGNRTAFLVSAARADFDGEVALAFEGLPAGVAAETLPVAAGQTQVPVLLTAGADAPLAGALAGVRGTAKVGEAEVVGQMHQRTSLVRGQNNREVWNHETNRMAVAVTEKAPFRIEIVQPKAPLVQSGSMDLRVRAAREEGFQAPITLRMLYNPPGVSSPVAVTMPEGQSEVAVPLTADGGAAVRTWRIAVLGETDAGGRVTAASQLAELTVAEPFFKFAFFTATAEQGQPAALAVKVEKNKDFEGTVKVELLGLPNEVTAEAQQITKDSTDVVFTLQTTANSPAGQHKGLVCRATATVEGEPVVHVLGPGELKIFKPLPPKPEAKPEPKPEPKPETPPAPKPLSRLEQLRLEREQALKAGQPAAKP